MRRAFLRLLALLAPVLVGLGTSALLLVDYLRKAPVLCAEGGCDAVKRTALAYPLGIPTPLFGVLAFAAMGTLLLVPGERARRALLVLAALSALVGLGFIAVQFQLGSLCPYCTVVDTCAALAFGGILLREQEGWSAPTDGRTRGSAVTLLAVALGAPLLVALALPPAVPSIIALELAKGPPGKVVVVDFADFECPYCRMTHDALRPMLEQHKDRVLVVRKLVPLTRIHPHALDAARAACCGEALGKGDAMADALFDAPVEELTPEGCLKIARELGLDEAAFRACLTSAETEARLKRDRETFDQAALKGDGLPLLWFGTDKLMGAADEETLRDKLEGAIARAGS